MTCRELIESLASYLEDDLDPLASERYVRHLSGCRSCSAYLQSYRLTIRVVREALLQ